MSFLYIPEYSIDDVSEITLLTPGEWEDAVSTVPNIPVHQQADWWIFDPDGKHMYITKSGLVSSVTYNNGQKGIRPVFIFGTTLFSGNGSKIKVEGTICTIIDKHKALSDELLAKRNYDDVKEFLNSPYLKALLLNDLPF